MAAVIVATTSTYQPDSQGKLSFTGFLDANNVALTSSNGSAKITITNAVTLAVLVNAAAMSYSGTPGQWDYSGLAAAFPDYTTLSVVLAGYDNTGATLYISQDITLAPNPMAIGTYSRNSINNHAFPAYSATPGGALLDTSNSLAKISIAAAGTGTVILASTSMTYQAGPPKQWIYNAAASLFGAGQRMIVTCQGWDLTGNTTLYYTSKELLTDGL